MLAHHKPLDTRLTHGAPDSVTSAPQHNQGAPPPPFAHNFDPLRLVHVVCLQITPRVLVSRMASRLCNDEWCCISEFLQSAVLSHVCRRTWRLLQRQHLSFNANPDSVLEKVAALKGDARVRTLTVKCRELRAAGALSLAGLAEVPKLKTLILDLTSNMIGDAGALALAALKDAPSLAELTINLRGNLIRDSGAQALAGLKDAPSLQALTLNLRGNQIRDCGAHALATLRDSSSLRVLTLNLSSNEIW